MEEKWKDVVGYEGLYKVSNLGNVYTNYYKRLLTKHEKNGYYYVYLSSNGKQSFKFIHRLVAQAFIPNPNNLPCINHKDENRTNNTVENLEWCNHLYNNNYGKHLERVSESNKKPCVGVNVNNDSDIRIFNSRQEAAQWANVPSTHITRVIKGKRKSAGGYKWFDYDPQEEVKYAG